MILFKKKQTKYLNLTNRKVKYSDKRSAKHRRQTQQFHFAAFPIFPSPPFAHSPHHYADLKNDERTNDAQHGHAKKPH
jgi:hypothetical protein